MLYKRSELGLGDDLVPLYRSREELLSRECLASGEGKPLCSPHPSTFVTASNAAGFVKGQMQGLREGPRLEDGEYNLVADLIVYDALLADQIESGAVREISLGYDTAYYPHGADAYEQRAITINHVACVGQGREKSTG